MNIIPEKYVDYMVKITYNIINEWPLLKKDEKLMELEKFIKYILKNLQITYYTLIISLIYMSRIKQKILTNGKKDKIILSNRRMFIISLIIANNFLGYKNKNWTRITGLGNDEISICINKFLDFIYPDLYITNDCFNKYKNKINENYKNHHT